jgi:hypothetical protein
MSAFTFSSAVSLALNNDDKPSQKKNTPFAIDHIYNKRYTHNSFHRILYIALLFS